MTSTIYIGTSPGRDSETRVAGQFVEIDGEMYYQIQHYDQMPPFFMSIVSDSDHWMFVSSLGSLTAGRQNPDHALFPYYTVDRIHDGADQTGSKTLLLIKRAGKTHLWEPFSRRYQGVYNCTSSLYKSVYGDKIRFEATNEDLGVRFTYTWCTGEQFGFIKHSQITCTGDTPVTVEVLDGIQNLLHCGIELGMQTERSNLLDAYKKSELDGSTGLGIFALSSLVVDKPIPSESLNATTVWCAGLKPEAHLVSMRQLDAFRRGKAVSTERDIRAARGGYFVQTNLSLQPGANAQWYIVAEINQGPEQVAALIDLLATGNDLRTDIEADVADGTTQLKRLVASADGMQSTADLMTTTRHYANVLFNIMRGGVFDKNLWISRADLIDTIARFNRPVHERHQAFFDALPAEVSVTALLARAADQPDRQLERLCFEYLPLIFSRRHGDPSRPWNRFSIDLRHADGSTRRSYQGNWRDIFQNWEALCLSYPAFTESIISKFVNASTVDGYNPYRITQDGIDWEIMDPHDPWSYIGYWGDHQIIYLLKLLEISRAHHPNELAQLLTRDVFAYANVPYRIKGYADLLEDPHNTILYDEAEEARIAQRVAKLGADGKLVLQADGQVYQVNLTEKLLVTVLTKLSNFIPGAGIWLNTQRPEWNDANNALVGYGVSMVTLCYLRRFNSFAAALFDALGETDIQLSEEVATLWSRIAGILDKNLDLLQGVLTNQERKQILDALGRAGSTYRASVYQDGFSGRKETVSAKKISAFFEQTLAYIDHTLWANQRSDKLFHAYNLMQVQEDGVAVSHLYEMLEGQVAVLSAGLLSGQQVVEVLAALKASALYREDQNSYILYPDRSLPRFTEKNLIPTEVIQRSPLLRKLTAENNTALVIQDSQKNYRFNGQMRDRDAVAATLEALASAGYGQEVADEKQDILDVYATVFNHKEYTGRSGNFFGYEGLGSIYWHMVSKLVLAINEAYFTLVAAGEDIATLGKIVEYYYDIRAGIGLNKPPNVYGAFPFDPYSHTPAHAGARQPGMTGQVKEDIISRWGELGVVVQNGALEIQPVLLRAEEFQGAPGAFSYVDINGAQQTISLPENTLAFTYCQVPFIYRKATAAKITLVYKDGQRAETEGLYLDATSSSKILDRSGSVACVYVDLMPAL
ncbi:MAG: hypothetical protein AAF564_17645 [Bacteroidota bacterium]